MNECMNTMIGGQIGVFLYINSNVHHTFMQTIQNAGMKWPTFALQSCD